MSVPTFLEQLNEEQLAAVLDESPVCLVNAYVGSGKTTVLIHKVLYLHKVKQVPYENMIVLTFTNKAADEIKERLLKEEPLLTNERLKGFGTFHGVALSLLQNQLPVEQLGYTKDFYIIEPEEELELAKQLILSHKLKVKYQNRLRKRLEQEKTVCKYKDDLFLLRELLQEEKKKK